MNGNRQDIVNARIISSHIWSNFSKFKLDTNMRLVGSSSNLNGDFTLKQNQYADLILDIGNGKMTPYVTIALKRMKT
jgi:PIF1-like helicase